MTSATSLKNMTVLIADDDDVTRGLLRQVLRQCQLHVVGEARDGKEALDAFRKLKPSIVCLDVQMPEMTGLEALTVIRAEVPSTIIIMITGTTTAEVIKGAIAGGADGIIAKPFSAAKILAELTRCLTRAEQKKTSTATTPTPPAS